MSKKHDDDAPAVYIIPTNFINSGRIMNGMFKTRNFIEALISTIILFLILNLIPFSSNSTKITVLVSVIGPVTLACLVGINDDTAFTFVKSVFSWRKNRRVMLYNRNQEVQKIRALDAMMDRSLPRDKLLKIMEDWKEQRQMKAEDISLIEGETFRFAEDADIARINQTAERLQKLSNAVDAKEKASTDDEPGETLNLISGTFSEEFDDG